MFFVVELNDRGLFVAQGDRGVEAAGAPGGEVAGGAGDEDEGGGGQGNGEGIVGREAEELALYDAGEREGREDAGVNADGDEQDTPSRMVSECRNVPMSLLLSLIGIVSYTWYCGYYMIVKYWPINIQA